MEKLELVKQFIEDNRIIENFNRNLSRKKFWDKYFPNLSDFVFDYFKECNKLYYDNLRFIDFLKVHICGLPTNNKYRKHYNNLIDCLLNQNINSLTQTYKNYVILESKKYLNFQTDYIPEIKYCVLNNLTEKPKCKYCNKDVHFNNITKGYHEFCSFDCQLNYNNMKKEPKLSEFSDGEIRKIIEKIPLDRRNMTNVTIADVYLNIYNYSKHIEGLPEKERIYIFQNKLTNKDIFCSCGEKRVFISQGFGYRKTCTKYGCIRKLQPNNKNPIIGDEKLNSKLVGNKSSITKSFIYILYSKELDLYKIGIAISPFRRLKKLQIYVPDLELVFSMYKNNTCYCESYFHKKYEDKKFIFDTSFDGSTEYFKLTKQYFEDIKQEIMNNEF